MTSFVDIKITGINETSSHNPDSRYALYNVYLNLSSNPPSEWITFFDNSRAFPRHSMWRRAWIERSAIVVYCVPDELQKYHLSDLKQDVSTANEQYKKYLMQQEMRNQKAESEAKDAKERFKSSIKDLKFD